MVLHIDMKPALSQEQLKNKLIRDFEAAGGHSLKNTMIHMLPKSMVPVLLERSGLKLDQKANQITKEERQKIADNIKNFTLTLTGLRSWDEAIITRGGVQVDEINPQTMESKLVKGLYLAGEILDLDALTGGYNLQIAWSTGYAAGTAGIFGQ